jgi:signal recognition particle subunit SEC65
MEGTVTTDVRNRGIVDLTRALFGQDLTLAQVAKHLAIEELVSGERSEPVAEVGTPDLLWVGSAGYERYRDNAEFAQRIAHAGVLRLIDVRALPISRRRGYAKTALAEAMRAAGIEYVHIRELGNPKEFRDLYKSGRAAEGRAGYEAFLLSERREALDELAEMLREKPAALMCVEHDSSVCHRAVILDALRSELGLSLDVANVS